jgi:CheY-like chemotaxis protein
LRVFDWTQSTESAGRAGSAEKHLLILVEDDPDDAALLERALRKAHVSADVRWVQSGAEALAILASLTFEATGVCLVVDVNLPGMDGFQLLERVKTQFGPSRVKFVFLTGQTDSAAKLRAKKCGADAFFLKPARCEDLMGIALALEELMTERPYRLTARPGPVAGDQLRLA